MYLSPIEKKEKSIIMPTLCTPGTDVHIDLHGITVTPTSIVDDSDDDFFDIVNMLFDDGSHEENCNFVFGECDERAKFSITSRDFYTDEPYVLYYCPKHFVFELHHIIDAITADHWFDDLATSEDVQKAFSTYFTDAQRICG